MKIPMFPGFHTIKMVDFPWRTVSLQEGTIPKTNIAPTNGWLEYYFPIGEAYFQGLR